jgi:hypothetical protein
MKTLIITVALLMFSSVAWGQSTTTIRNTDGSTTKITAQCDGQGDCSVWDSTHELGIRAAAKLLKAQKAFCKSQGISDKMVKAYDTDTMLGGKNINQECYAAWEKHEAEKK